MQEYISLSYQQATLLMTKGDSYHVEVKLPKGYVYRAGGYRTLVHAGAGRT